MSAMAARAIALRAAKAIQRRGRHLWKRYLRWPTPIWRLRGYACLRVGNHNFKFCVDDVTLWWAWRVYQGDWEEEVAHFVKQVIRPGDVFFDLGAYTGGYTLLASRLVQPGGHVYAFEPDPVARALLTRNLNFNRVSNVTVLPYALAAREGPARLKGSTWLASGQLGTSDSMVTSDDGPVQIETMTLAGFCARHQVAPSVVKIDTPGGEDKVFAGGIDVLRNTRATILELNERKLREAGQDPSAFLDSLFDLGKRILVLHRWSDQGPPPGTELTRRTAIAGHMNLALLDRHAVSAPTPAVSPGAATMKTGPMRIAVYVPEDRFLDPGYSGDHVFVRSLVAGLRARGHQVNVVSRLDPAGFPAGDISLRRLAAEGIAVRTAMKRFAPDAWLVYAPSDHRPDLFGWWQRPKRYVLFAAHAPVRARIPWSWRTAVLSLAHRRALARADVITAFRHPSYARLRAYGIPEARLRLLPPAAQARDWLPSQEDARRHLGLPRDTPIILCVGRFSVRRKGGEPRKTEMMLDLIGAVAPLPPDAVLVIVGEGVGRPQLEAATAQLKPQGRVRFAGYVQHEELHWWYASCDLYAFPHPKDDSWVSILEAQYCGRPVVTMRTRSGEETVQHGCTGLLAANLEEFRAQVAALASDRARCAAMGKAARAYIAAHHSMETRLRQIEDLLLGRD